MLLFYRNKQAEEGYILIPHRPNSLHALSNFVTGDHAHPLFVRLQWIPFYLSNLSHVLFRNVRCLNRQPYTKLCHSLI
jgi:hypothetical protein